MSDAGRAAHFREQADFCERMGTPLYGALMRSAADDYDARGPLYGFYDAKPELAQYSHEGIRLFGALHRCALEGSAPEYARHMPSCGGDGEADAAWSAARDVLVRERERVARYYAQTPQTNEVGRSTLLLGATLQAVAAHPSPVAWYELAASAGLNSRLDSYRYEGDGWTWGDPQSQLALRNSTRSGVPAALDAPLEIRERHACDLNPLDIEREDDRIALLSFLWPDQLERFARLQAAIATARRTPLTIERADMREWVRAIEPRSEMLSVIAHSVVLEHLPSDVREDVIARIRAALARASARAPVAWVRMELEDGTYVTRVTSAPDGIDRIVARSDGHGQGIAWA